jgi:hypothetical protein
VVAKCLGKLPAPLLRQAQYQITAFNKVTNAFFQKRVATLIKPNVPARMNVIDNFAVKQLFSRKKQQVFANETTIGRPVHVNNFNASVNEQCTDESDILEGEVGNIAYFLPIGPERGNVIKWTDVVSINGNHAPNATPVILVMCAYSKHFSGNNIGDHAGCW